jgi:hypothetical protein
MGVVAVDAFAFIILSLSVRVLTDKFLVKATRPLSVLSLPVVNSLLSNS